MKFEKHRWMMLAVISCGFIITGFIFSGIANSDYWKLYIRLALALAVVIIVYYPKKSK